MLILTLCTVPLTIYPPYIWNGNVNLLLMLTMYFYIATILNTLNVCKMWNVNVNVSVILLNKILLK